MKILVICQYYYPEPFRLSDICSELVRMGHEVQVITGVPNYPLGVIYKDYRHGKKRDEEISGVRIHRCFTIGRRKSVIFRFLNYYSYALSATRYVKKIDNDYDVIFVNQLSPIMMAYPALKYKEINNKKIVLYCLDLWPDALTSVGISKKTLIYKHFWKISNKIYGNSDRILVSSKSFINYFQNEFGIYDATHLPQYAEDIFLPEKCIKKKDGYLDLMFAGNLGISQSVSTIVEAAKLTEDNEKIRWHIVGDGSELDRMKNEAKGLKNISFYGRVPVEKMPEFYSKADAMIVTLVKSRVHSYTLPGKVQTYMAAGKPILGSADGETALIISESKCGICCEAERPDELAKIVRSIYNSELLEEYSRNAIAYYRKHYSKEKVLTDLENTLEHYSG